MFANIVSLVIIISTYRPSPKNDTVVRTAFRNRKTNNDTSLQY